MNAKKLDYGITLINYDISCDFLSLRPHVYNGESTIDIEYCNVLCCFELLCAGNLRDLFLAKEKLNKIGGGILHNKYKFVYMALTAWSNQNIEESRYYFRHHLNSYGSDVTVYHMFHMLDFVTGNHQGYLEYLKIDVEIRDPKLKGFLNGIISFSLIENDMAEQAIELAKIVVSENTDDIYSTHSLVHCLHIKKIVQI